MLRNKIILLFWVLAVAITSNAYAAAPKKDKEEVKEIPLPEEIWTTPIHYQIMTKSGRPMNVPVLFKLTLHEGGFEKVCELMPDIVDELSLYAGEKVHPANFMASSKKGTLFLEMTKFIKNKFPVRDAVYSVEVYKKLPEMDKDTRAFYNKCNQMPVKLLK